MVKVYFESSNHAELVAVFVNEETYSLCLDALEKEAKDNNMVVTESIESDTLKEFNELYKENESLSSENWSLECDNDSLSEQITELEDRLRPIEGIGIDNISHSDLQDLKELIAQFKKDRFII